jgi:hypothetical protein
VINQSAQSLDLIPLATTRVENHKVQQEAVLTDLLKFGVRYLSQKFPAQFRQEQSADEFLAALVLQPDHRIRKAFIAVVLVHPEYAQCIPIALRRLNNRDQYIMKLLYTATVFLQQKYRGELGVFLGYIGQGLPDLYSSKLAIGLTNSLDENLKLVGIEYQLRTGEIIDWTDSCDHLVCQLLK